MPEIPKVPAGERIISNPQSAGKIGVSPTTFWRMERQAAAAGRWFPQKIKISKGRVGRLESEVERLLAELVAASREDAA